MTEKQWDTFFRLLAKIVALPGTPEDRAAAVKDAASPRGEKAVGPFEEFTSWDWE